MRKPETKMHKSDDATLISALRILANEIYSEDGVAIQCIREAADRLQELVAEIASMKHDLDEEAHTASDIAFIAYLQGYEKGKTSVCSSCACGDPDCDEP